MKHPPFPTRDPEPDDPPSEEEVLRADALREALSDPARENDDAALARALVLTHSPRPLARGENEAMVERALARPTAPASLAAARVRKRAWVGPATAAASTLAFAAAALIFQARSQDVVASLDPQLPARVRSAQPLFHEPFAQVGARSARIDRIASARAGDLRENMFARWDVR